MNKFREAEIERIRKSDKTGVLAKLMANQNKMINAITDVHDRLDPLESKKIRNEQ